jgi:hypothetical protein
MWHSHGHPHPEPLTQALGRTLIWNPLHLLHALEEFESFYNRYRPHRALRSAAPLHPVPEPITEPDRSFCHTSGRGENKHLMIPGWPYSVVAALETGRAS